MTTLIINDGATITKNVTGLLKYTEYEFQVLAFTSAGDGRNSSVISERTKEDGKKGKNCDGETYLIRIRSISVFIFPFDIRVRVLLEHICEMIEIRGLWLTKNIHFHDSDQSPVTVHTLF